MQAERIWTMLDIIAGEMVAMSHGWHGYPTVMPGAEANHLKRAKDAAMLACDELEAAMAARKNDAIEIGEMFL